MMCFVLTRYSALDIIEHGVESTTSSRFESGDERPAARGGLLKSSDTPISPRTWLQAMEGAIAAPSLESMVDGRAEAEREKAERAENERREQERMKELERQEADPTPATFSILK